MKIIICNIPLREEPDNYPPLGSIVLVQSLRLAGYDPYFYDIDAHRPSFEEVVGFIKDQAPDVLCISAVVSTAYAYTKQLALAIKEVSPSTKIVVGGNLAASAELLLRFCKVDLCGIGEGERVIVNLVKYWEGHKEADDYSQLRQIKGLTYLDESGEMVFTGYEVAIPATEFLDYDYSILEQYSKIENYVIEPLERYDFAQDVRSYEPHRRGKKLATVISAKGCVARCTFCHRWDRGYRHWPVARIMDNIHYLMDRYNVGFISFGDENFGSDRPKLDELIECMKPLDILYKVSGVRVASVDLDLLKRLKDSGCVAMYYGIETGSESILKIMEKNAKQEQNVNAVRWTYEAGLYTVYQFVLAMPGEDHSTIAETSRFVSQITEFLPEPPHTHLSINYIQALPGTPVYEQARSTGLIGPTLEDEEDYLLRISDVNAADDSKFLNFTPYDYLTVQSWRPRIVFDAEANWFKKHQWKRAPKQSEAARLNGQLPDTEADEDYSRKGYFNLGHVLIKQPWFYRILSLPICYPLRVMYPAAYVLNHDFKVFSKRRMMAYFWEWFWTKLKKRPSLKDTRSLRRIMKEKTPVPISKSDESMLPLREGR